MGITKRRAIIIAVVALIASFIITMFVDNAKANADRTGHQSPGIHKVRVTKTTVVRYRVKPNGYRVRGATHVRAVNLLNRRSAAFKKRLCVGFGKESPHQQFPTINVFCNKHVKKVTNNLVECGGQGAIAATAVAILGPGAEIAFVAAFGGCEFSKTFAYFQRQQCRARTPCAVRMAAWRQAQQYSRRD